SSVSWLLPLPSSVSDTCSSRLSPSPTSPAATTPTMDSWRLWVLTLRTRSWSRREVHAH
ncbi:hypothetical protein BGZ91_008619, partial [Linnemannia elongata]